MLAISWALGAIGAENDQKTVPRALQTTSLKALDWLIFSR